MSNRKIPCWWLITVEGANISAPLEIDVIRVYTLGFLYHNMGPVVWLVSRPGSLGTPTASSAGEKWGIPTLIYFLLKPDVRSFSCNNCNFRGMPHFQTHHTLQQWSQMVVAPVGCSSILTDSRSQHCSESGLHRSFSNFAKSWEDPNQRMFLLNRY